MTVTAPRPTSTAPAPRQRRWGSRRTRLIGGVAGVLVTVLIATLVLWLSHGTHRDPQPSDSNVPLSWRRPVVTADGLVQQSGVKVTQVAVTGDGGLVDLRYRVIDPERAST